MRVFGKIPNRHDPSYGVLLLEKEARSGDGIWVDLPEAIRLLKSLDRELRRIMLKMEEKTTCKP